MKAVIFDMYETLVTLYACPPFFGRQIAEDLSISAERFLPRWNGMEQERTVGALSLEQALAEIMRAEGCFSEERLQRTAAKRLAAKRACFAHLHPGILPMLAALKGAGMKLGLVSNCFSEETVAIRESALFPFFDAACLSYELGLQKPDPAIFLRCTEELSVPPTDCAYIGDGGSRELEAAQALGMQAMQAVWYLKEGTGQPVGRLPAFVKLEAPGDAVKQITGNIVDI